MELDGVKQDITHLIVIQMLWMKDLHQFMVDVVKLKDRIITYYQHHIQDIITVDNALCLPCVCGSDQVAVGCSASDSHAKTAAFSGVQRINRPNNGESGCKAQRGDRGYLWVAPVMIIT